MALRNRISSAIVAFCLIVLGVGTSTGAGETTVTVTNSAPVVLDVTLPATSFTPTAGSTTSVTTTVVVEDLNGCSDLSSVTVEVVKPDGTTSHIAASAATYSSCAAGTSATYTKSFNMNFHDAAALLTNTYKVKVVATDSQGAKGDNTASLAVFNYAQLAALNLNASTVDFGSSISPGATTATQQLGVQNHGNIQIDVQLSGSALAHATESTNIPVSNITYSLASNMSGSAALSTSATTLAAFDLASGASSSKTLYWALSVPSGDVQWVPSGNYTGTLTVSAIAG